MTKRTSNTRCVLVKGAAAPTPHCNLVFCHPLQPASKSSIPAAPATEKLMDEAGAAQRGVVWSERTRGQGSLPQSTQRRVRDTQPPVEVVQCADCPRTFERLIVPKGRPRLYCTKSCANYASRRRVKGTTLTPVKVAMHNWQQAQRPAAPPPATFTQALHALRGLPDLHAILSGENPDAVQSEHGHEASDALPPRPRAHPAHPAETQQKPTNLRTRPTKGDERKRK